MVNAERTLISSDRRLRESIDVAAGLGLDAVQTDGPAADATGLGGLGRGADRWAPPLTRPGRAGSGAGNVDGPARYPVGQRERGRIGGDQLVVMSLVS